MSRSLSYQTPAPRDTILGSFADESQGRPSPDPIQPHSWTIQEATDRENFARQGSRVERDTDSEGITSLEPARGRNTWSQQSSPSTPSPPTRPVTTGISEAAFAGIEEMPLGQAVVRRIILDGKATIQIQFTEDPGHATSSEWEARKINGERRTGGQTFYKVAWKSTWEPESNLTHMEELLREWKQRKAVRRAGRGTVPKDGVQKTGRRHP